MVKLRNPVDESLKRKKTPNFLPKEREMEMREKKDLSFSPNLLPVSDLSVSAASDLS